jgi:hypothetical protein
MMRLLQSRHGIRPFRREIHRLFVLHTKTFAEILPGINGRRTAQKGEIEMAGITAAWGTHDEMMVKGVNWDSLREKMGGAFVPDSPPEDEAAFWRNLLGEKPFYCWTDIF